MKVIIHSALIMSFFCLSNVLIAQEEQSTLVDLFYEILISEEEFNNSGKEAVVIASRDERISPESIITKYPEAEKYLEDSLLVFSSEINIKFRLEESSLSMINLRFKEPLRISCELSIDDNNMPLQPDIFIFDCTLDSLLEFNDYQSPNGIVINESKIHCLKGYFDLPGQIGLLQLVYNEIEILTISNANFKTLLFTGNTFRSVWISHTEAKRFSFTGNEIINRKEHMVISDSSQYWRERLSKIHFWNDSSTFLNQSSTYSNFNISFNSNFEDVYISGNFFKSDALNPITVYDAKSFSLSIEDNIFESTFLLSGKASDSFKLTNNTFWNGISLFSFGIPETPIDEVVIDWIDLSKNLIIVFGEGVHGGNFVQYFGKNDLELASSSTFDLLIKSYSKIFKGFRDYGFIDKANQSYYEMKNVYLRKLAYNFRMDGNVTNFYKLKLGQILRVYTKHGTDPGQAITASFWIILLFALIYSFFPSEWDTMSKSQHISNFRNFMQKNDKGFIKPLFVMIGGLLLSFLNAITLSINSFVTLGFGKIPTRGAAKYICIIQGFMGWFLLGIFMVALINQVLF